MKAYKLTDENGRTGNDMQWGEGVTHEATGTGQELCSDGWIHFYTDLLVGVFMNPRHAGFENPIAWECKTAGKELHEPLKSGCKKLTTIKQIPIPHVTPEQRVAFGILCAKQVYKDENWNIWADNWLSEKDRTKKSAYAAAYAATAYAAAYAAAINAADAATINAADAANAAADAAAAACITVNFSDLARQALENF